MAISLGILTQHFQVQTQIAESPQQGKGRVIVCCPTQRSFFSETGPNFGIHPGNLDVPPPSSPIPASDVYINRIYIHIYILYMINIYIPKESEIIASLCGSEDFPMVVKNLYTMDGCLGKPPLISGCLGVAGRIYTSTA